VIYLSSTLTWNNQGLWQYRYWLDPRRAIELGTIVSFDGSTDRYFIDGVHGRRFDALPGSPRGGEPLPPALLRELRLEAQAYAQGGLLGIYRMELAHAIGPVRHVSLRGAPAVFYRSGFARPNMAALFQWNDPATGRLLRDDVSYKNGTLSTEDFAAETRIPPNTLPADFFAPPAATPTLWGRIVGWAQDWVAGR
jgi:hypothetical protein